MKNCLHLLVSSSAEAMAACRSHFKTGDTVFLLDDGVMAFAADDSGFISSSLRACHFSAADLEARGLINAARDAGASIVDDAEFIELLQQYDFCLTWK